MEPMSYAAVVTAGSLISAFGQSKASKAQADAARKMARAKRQQALTLLERAEENRERIRLSGANLVKEQQASFASGGVVAGAGSTLAVMNDTMNKTEQQSIDMMTDARSKAAALRAGADVDMQLAGDIQSASGYQLAGSLISGGYQAAKAGGYVT